jgi:uncharacterized protein YceH (UPF0502 family)
MRVIDDLNPTQIRILGALLEKEQATPDYYPLTVNALLAACNQKSNRDPVTAITEGEIWDELEALRAEVLVWRSEGARAERWSQSISRRLELDPEEKAILTVLMLRGPQTVGELRTRTARLHAFEDLERVHDALERLATEERDLAVELPRRPGQKESRWMQRLGGETPMASDAGIVGETGLAGDPAGESAAVNRGGPSLSERVAGLERQVGELTETVQRLLRDLGS